MFPLDIRARALTRLSAKIIVTLCALAGIGRRARVELVDGGILIRPAEDDRAEPVAPASDSAESPYADERPDFLRPGARGAGR